MDRALTIIPERTPKVVDCFLLGRRYDERTLHFGGCRPLLMIQQRKIMQALDHQANRGKGPQQPTHR